MGKKFIQLTAALNEIEIHVDPAHVECVLGRCKDSGKHVGCAIRFASGEIVGVQEDIETVLSDLKGSDCE